MAERVGGIFYSVELDTGRAIQQQREVDRIVGQAARSFNVITTAVKLYAAALTALKLSEVADDFRLLQARVNVATDSIEAGTRAFEQLRAISISTRSALADNVQVFTRLNPAITQMGGSANDTLRVVELLSKAITVSGATAAEKSAAMVQFAQALGSGKLAGDELRSLLENAPYLMKQLADGLGVPIGQLRSLGEQGKLTADVVVNALTKAAERISKDFAQFPQTISSALQVAKDEFARLNTELDNSSGKNAVLTGIVKGLGSAFGLLADQIVATRTESDKLTRNDQIERWATSTAKVMSGIVDAADFVSRGFEQMGTLIGGTAAMAARAAEGDLRGVIASFQAMKKDIYDIGNRPYLGSRMRGAIDAAGGKIPMPKVEDTGPPSKLKATVDPEDQRKLAAKRAAAQAYYEGLLADTRTGLARIDAEEQKALQENMRRSQADAANADVYARAKTLIVEKFARERALLQEQYAREAAAVEIAVTTDEQTRITKIRDEAFRAADEDVRLGVKTFEQGEQAKRLAAFQFGVALVDAADRAARAEFEMHMAATHNAAERIALIERETVRAAELAHAMGKITAAELDAVRARASRQSSDDLKALGVSRSQTRIDTLQLRAGSGGFEDQEALIRAQAEAQITATLEAQTRDLENRQLYADQVVAIEQDMHRRIEAMRSQGFQNALGSTASAFEALANATRSGTDKQSGVYKAAFLAQKAFSIASSIVAIQTGVAQAAALPFPANLAAMASVIAATASIIATIKGTNYGGGRQYGGPVDAGSLYRINESGRPEMFTAGNGSQYMLPTASGRVTSADRVSDERGGGRAATVIHLTQNFHIPQGTSMQTQQQVAASAARGLQAAAARNN